MYHNGAAFQDYAPLRRSRSSSAISERSSQIFRRIVNVSICIVILMFISPLMLLLFFVARMQDGGPALYGQLRCGRHGRTFRCLKFRTMVIDSDERLAALLAKDSAARAEWARDHKLRDDPRITPLGAFLRRSSLDELPQLFNVLRGEMDLVGPRPIVAAEVVRYGPRYRHYCAVRPGITGLWQVSGRNDVSYRRRVAMDALYARSQSLGFDMKILLMTLPAVLSRRGSY